MTRGTGTTVAMRKGLPHDVQDRGNVEVLAGERPPVDGHAGGPVDSGTGPTPGPGSIDVPPLDERRMTVVEPPLVASPFAVQRWRRALSPWGLLSIALGLILWGIVGSLRPFVISPPPAVARTARAQLANGQLWQQVGPTLGNLLLGLGIAIAIGVPFGILMAQRERTRAVANMYLYWLFALPEVALIPFYIVALGYGRTARIFVIVLFALPVVTQRALIGAAEVPTNLLDMARSFEFPPAQVFRRIVLPWALPSVVTGIRLGYLRALIGVIAAGIFAQLFGMGGQIWLSAQSYETATMYMYIVAVAVLGLTGNALIGLFDRRANWWAIAGERDKR